MPKLVIEDSKVSVKGLFDQWEGEIIWSLPLSDKEKLYIVKRNDQLLLIRTDKTEDGETFYDEPINVLKMLFTLQKNWEWIMQADHQRRNRPTDFRR